MLAEENPPRVESHASSATVAKSALAAAKDALSVTASQMHGKAIVTETRMFGGQSVEVSINKQHTCYNHFLDFNKNAFDLHLHGAQDF